MLKRKQLFEFCDQKWLQGSLREAYMDCLNFVHNTYQPYHYLMPSIVDWAANRSGDKILDLASGGAEQISILLKYAEKQGVSFPTFVIS
jgi:hypothetical protein